MDDKKDYKNMLKAINFNGSYITILTKISDASITTDDKKLKELSTNLTEQLRIIVGPFPTHGNVKNSLIARSTSKDFPLPNSIKESLTRLAHYCEDCISSSEPQWMNLARKAGWTPPIS